MSCDAHIPSEVLADYPEGVEGPQVGYGVAALVGGAVGRVRGAWQAVLVGQGSIGLQGMACEATQHVHTCACMHAAALLTTGYQNH